MIFFMWINVSKSSIIIIHIHSGSISKQFEFTQESTYRRFFSSLQDPHFQTSAGLFQVVGPLSSNFQFFTFRLPSWSPHIKSVLDCNFLWSNLHSQSCSNLSISLRQDALQCIYEHARLLKVLHIKCIFWKSNSKVLSPLICQFQGLDLAWH